MDKVFPDHWSFMLGEIALCRFVILLLTGTYLALFFNTRQRRGLQRFVRQARGITMTDAYRRP